jgi:hypothetical protein
MDKEHPAIMIAREIRQLHLDNIKMIDEGFVFHDKEGVSVNERMREACMEQIGLCDGIIETAKDLRSELLLPVELMLIDAKATIEKALEDAKDDTILPEIGNYDNDDPKDDA